MEERGHLRSKCIILIIAQFHRRHAVVIVAVDPGVRPRLPALHSPASGSLLRCWRRPCSSASRLLLLLLLCGGCSCSCRLPLLRSLQGRAVLLRLLRRHLRLLVASLPALLWRGRLLLHRRVRTCRCMLQLHDR